MLRVVRPLAGAALLFAAFASKVPAAPLAIRFGTLADGSGKKLSPAIVIVENGKIQSVGTTGAAIPAGN